MPGGQEAGQRAAGGGFAGASLRVEESGFGMRSRGLRGKFRLEREFLLMFNPKRVIPKLAVAALALSGCGETDNPNGFGFTGGTGGTGGSAGTGGTGGSSGTGGTGGTSGTGGTNGTTLASSLEAFCMKLIDCFPGYYDDTADCVSYLTTAYALDGPISSECEAAAISYFQCGAALTCPELEDVEGNSCVDEFEAAAQVCN